MSSEMLHRVVSFKLTKDSEDYFIYLIMEAVTASEMSVYFYMTTRGTISEDSHLRNRHSENLKCQS